MRISKAAVAAIFLGGTSMFAVPSPAEAQISRPRPQQQQPQRRQQPRACSVSSPDGQRQYRMSQPECVAITPVLQAITAQDWATARAGLAAAQAASQGTDAKYVTAQSMLLIGLGANDVALQAQAIDAMIASGGALPNEMQALYENQLRLALAAGDTAKAQQAQARLDALNPNDPLVFVRQAQAHVRANNFAAAVPLYLQAMQRAQAAGQPVPADWRRFLAGAAYQAHDANTMRYMREWLAVAPSPSAWHDTLVILAEQGGDAAMKLDIYRLLRSAGGMTGERDYMQYAEAAQDNRAFAEVATILQEGLSRNLISVNAAYARERLAQAQPRATEFRAIIAQERQSALAGRDAQHALYVAHAYYGAGQYAEAAELYRAALAQGADANATNTRLGAALALAGRRAEAETALGLVTGPRAELAQLWRLWLSTRS